MLLSLNKLHCGDRSQEKDGRNGQGMNGQPSNRKNGINNWLVRRVSHQNSPLNSKLSYLLNVNSQPLLVEKILDLLSRIVAIRNDRQLHLVAFVVLIRAWRPKCIVG